MNTKLLEYYNRELHHLRKGMGAEFAREFPQIAGRLSVEHENVDPYVDRLFEGFAFMAARVQLKIDAQFPRFTESLLESLYPGALQPRPAATIVQFAPDPTGGLLQGHHLERGFAMRGALSPGMRTHCEYRTAHPVTLWPIELAEVQYARQGIGVAGLGIGTRSDVRAFLRLRLRTLGGLRFDQLALDRLVIHLSGHDEVPGHLFEQLATHTLQVVVRPAKAPAPWMEDLPAGNLRTVGLADAEALLPVTSRGFTGFRLLSEYFLLPGRFRFVELSGLLPAVRRCAENQLDVIFLFGADVPIPEHSLQKSHVALHATPVVNLFSKELDLVEVTPTATEHHVVADRQRSADFEIVALQRVGESGLGAGGRQFRPLYERHERDPKSSPEVFYTTRRIPRPPEERPLPQRALASYRGSELFLTLVDRAQEPADARVRSLEVKAWCTNRDLPLLQSFHEGSTHFTPVGGAPIAEIRALTGKPTPPRPPLVPGDAAWKLVRQLSLNHLSLVERAGDGAALLRELLELFADTTDPSIDHQIKGVVSVESRPVMRRIEDSGPIAFVRGIEITLTLDEGAFRGTGVMPLAVALEEYFARYVSINSFTELVLRTVQRREVMRWKPRTGCRPIL